MYLSALQVCLAAGKLHAHFQTSPIDEPGTKNTYPLVLSRGGNRVREHTVDYRRTFNSERRTANRQKNRNEENEADDGGLHNNRKVGYDGARTEDPDLTLPRGREL